MLLEMVDTKANPPPPKKHEPNHLANGKVLNLEITTTHADKNLNPVFSKWTTKRRFPQGAKKALCDFLCGQFIVQLISIVYFSLCFLSNYICTMSIDVIVLSVCKK